MHNFSAHLIGEAAIDLLKFSTFHIHFMKCEKTSLKYFHEFSVILWLSTCYHFCVLFRMHFVENMKALNKILAQFPEIACSELCFLIVI